MSYRIGGAGSAVPDRVKVPFFQFYKIISICFYLKKLQKILTSDREEYKILYPLRIWFFVVVLFFSWVKGLGERGIFLPQNKEA
jgi:hypothetical protein